MLPLLRSNGSMDKVPPMQINANGNVVSDRYCKDFSSQSGHADLEVSRTAWRRITLTISGLGHYGF